MADRTVSLNGSQWAVGAPDPPLTSPTPGVTYKKSNVSAGEFATAWPFQTKVDSGIYNEMMYRITVLIGLLEEMGILVWCATTPYLEGGLVLGSNSKVYQALMNVPAGQDPTTNPVDGGGLPYYAVCMIQRDELDDRFASIAGNSAANFNVADATENNHAVNYAQVLALIAAGGGGGGGPYALLNGDANNLFNVKAGTDSNAVPYSQMEEVLEEYALLNGDATEQFNVAAGTGNNAVPFSQLTAQLSNYALKNGNASNLFNVATSGSGTNAVNYTALATYLTSYLKQRGFAASGGFGTSGATGYYWTGPGNLVFIWGYAAASTGTNLNTISLAGAPLQYIFTVQVTMSHATASTTALTAFVRSATPSTGQIVVWCSDPSVAGRYISYFVVGTKTS